MRIAFPTDDGSTIHRHFGQATQYTVVEIQDGVEAGRALRNKTSHQHGHSHDHNHGHDHNQGHDHNSMFAPVADCQVLIAGGMGTPAYAAAEAAGLAVILTAERTIDNALQAYLAGALVNQPALAHAPGRHSH